MSPEELRIIIIVYASAIIPLILLCALWTKIPKWILRLYVIFFLVCAFGWEVWFNYGLFNGDSVNLRRSDVLNQWLPQDVNWILNSMADAGTISLGGLYLVWVASKKNPNVFKKWSWGSFIILLVWCVGQNLFVEMFLYHDQLSIGKKLSWAPLSPLGDFYNPMLFEFKSRTVMLQTQLPWLFTSLIIYYFSIKINKKSG